MLFKTCPSSVQALSKRVQTPHFYVQAWEIRFPKILQKTAWPRPSFPTSWPFYNIRRTDDSHASASRAQAPGRRANLTASRILSAPSSFLVFDSLQIQATTLPPLFQRGESAAWIWKSYSCVYSELPVLAHDFINHRFHHHHRDHRPLLRLLSTACCDSSAYA